MVATLVIPQHGSSHLTVRCVRSLRTSDMRDWPMVVVSDGCPPGELECLEEELRGDTCVRILRQAHRGVTAAWNLGATVTETEALIFLNNDVVCRGDWGECFLERMKRGEGLCGTALRREVFPRELHSGVTSLVMFQGWCLGMRRELFERLGGFDERLVLYWSDTDFQMRCAERLGGWGWLRRGLMDGLPLRHVAHATTRGRAIQGWCREQWGRDRRTFVGKWRERLAISEKEFPWEQDVEIAAGL